MATNTGGIFGGGGFGGDPLGGAGGVVPISGGVFTGTRPTYGGEVQRPRSPIYQPMIPGGELPTRDNTQAPIDTVNAAPVELKDAPASTNEKGGGLPWGWIIAAAVVGLVLVAKE